MQEATSTQETTRLLSCMSLIAPLLTLTITREWHSLALAPTLSAPVPSLLPASALPRSTTSPLYTHPHAPDHCCPSAAAAQVPAQCTHMWLWLAANSLSNMLSAVQHTVPQPVTLTAFQSSTLGLPPNQQLDGTLPVSHSSCCLSHSNDSSNT